MGSGMGFCTLLVIKGVPPFTVIDASLSMRLTASSVIVTWNETRTVWPTFTSGAVHTQVSTVEPSSAVAVPAATETESGTGVPSASYTEPSGSPARAPSTVAAAYGPPPTAKRSAP